MSNQPGRTYYADRTRPYYSQSGNGLAITSLVLGILAAMSGWFFMGVIFGSAAVVFGIVGLKKSPSRGVALAGIITGGFGALSGAIFTTIWIVALMQAGSIPTTISNLSRSLAEQNKIVKAQISAKKDFAKGQTGIFGALQVKVISVQRNFVSETETLHAGEGKELIVVKLNVKNTSAGVKAFKNFGVKVSESSIVSSAPAVTVPPVFNGSSLTKGATAEGNVVFEIPKDATNLKLLYQEVVYDLENSKAETLTYSLGI